MKTMIHSFNTVLCLLLATIALQAQQPYFAKVFDTAQAYSIVRTIDNNYFMAGIYYSNYSRNGAALIKIDNNGNLLKAQKFGNNYATVFSHIIQSGDNYIIAGRVGLIETSNTGFLCVKINNNGDTLWTKAIDFGLTAQAIKVCQTSDMGCILTGNVSLNNAPNSKIAVAKLDLNGNLEWAKTYALGNNTNYSFTVKQMNDGSYIVGGYAENFPPYVGMGVIMSLAADGSFQWSKAYSLATGEGVSVADVLIENDGFMLYLASFTPMLVKTDFSGNVIWAKNYALFSSVNFDNHSVPGLLKTSDNGYAFVSMSWWGNPGSFTKTDANGNTLWSYMMDLPTSAATTMEDNGFLVVGNGPLIGVKSPTLWQSQIGIVKTDSTGYAYYCSQASGVPTEPVTLIEQTLNAVVASGATLKSTSITIGDLLMSAREGCVDFIGGIADDTPGTFQLIASPNPTSGQFELSFSDNNMHKVSSLEVVNALGEVVYQSFNSISSTISIDLSHQARGIYLMKALANDKVFVAKVLITD